MYYLKGIIGNFKCSLSQQYQSVFEKFYTEKDVPYKNKTNKC